MTTFWMMPTRPVTMRAVRQLRPLVLQVRVLGSDGVRVARRVGAPEDVRRDPDARVISRRHPEGEIGAVDDELVVRLIAERRGRRRHLIVEAAEDHAGEVEARRRAAAAAEAARAGAGCVPPLPGVEFCADERAGEEQCGERRGSDEGSDQSCGHWSVSGRSRRAPLGTHHGRARCVTNSARAVTAATPKCCDLVTATSCRATMPGLPRAGARRDTTVTRGRIESRRARESFRTQMQTPSLPATVPTPETRTLPTLAGPVAGSPAAPPSRVSIEGTVVADRVYRTAIFGFALCVPILLLLIFIEVGIAGWPALRQFGFSFLTSSAWDPVAGQFGAAPAIVGTIVTSIIALVIATPLALGVAIFLSEFSPVWLRQPLVVLRRSARRGAERRVRAVGRVLPAAAAARADHALPARHAPPRRDAVLHRAGVRTERARRGADPRDHGAAVHRGGLARGADGRARARSARRRSRSARRAGRRSPAPWSRTRAPASSAASSSDSAARSARRWPSRW